MPSDGGEPRRRRTASDCARRGPEEQSGTIMRQTSSSGVVAGGPGPGRSIEVFTMSGPGRRARSHHDVAGEALALRGDSDEVGPLGFAFTYINQLFGVCMPACLPTEVNPGIPQSINAASSLGLAHR